MLAYAYLRAGNLVSAAEQFQILDAAAALTIEDQVAYADMLARGGNLVHAVAIYKRLLYMNPNDAETRSKLIRIYLDQGHADEAAALSAAPYFRRSGQNRW